MELTFDTAGDGQHRNKKTKTPGNPGVRDLSSLYGDLYHGEAESRRALQEAQEALLAMQKTFLTGEKKNRKTAEEICQEVERDFGAAPGTLSHRAEEEEDKTSREAPLQEEKRAEGADISADDIMLMRSSLMGPMAGIGDTVSQSIAYPILAGICIQLALAGNFAGPIIFDVGYKILQLTCGYNMYMLGYKKGRDAIVDLLQSGIINKVLDAVSIVGLMVVGCMTVGNVKVDLSWLEFDWTNELGTVSLNLQTGVFDALLPGLLPLLVVLGTWALLSKKQVKPLTMVLIIFALGFALVAIKALMGLY